MEVVQVVMTLCNRQLLKLLKCKITLTTKSTLVQQFFQMEISCNNKDDERFHVNVAFRSQNIVRIVQYKYKNRPWNYHANSEFL